MSKATDKPLTPRERVESFIERLRHDVGAFVGQQLLADGYMQVRFERASYCTLPDGKAIYRDGTGYQRPATGNRGN
jgi:hypothetical protein